MLLLIWLMKAIPDACDVAALQDDFKNLNPLLPHHYFYIAKKSFRALQQNNFKVTEKDL